MIRPISDTIRYIGADDVHLDLFENQYIVPEGMSYNSYLVLDGKIAIMDTCDASVEKEWMENLLGALDGREPDYLVVHHMEPDHSALIGRVMDRWPSLKIVCTAVAARMLPLYFGNTDFSSRVITVGEGAVLDLGTHSLRFIMAGMVHWPEVMMSYDSTDKVLFSADAFGKFGALSLTGGLHCRPETDWACEARRYYFNICGKYGAQVKAVLAKTASFDIRTICPLHGPVLQETVGDAVALYRTWSSYEVETKGVMIACASIHGGTMQACETLASMLRERGVEKVALTDLCRCDKAEAVEDAFRYGVLVAAASSYDAGVFTPMFEFLHILQTKAWQKRSVAVIENGSWAPTAGRVMTEMLSDMREISFIEPRVTIRGRMQESDKEALAALADAIAAGL